ncbi:unnamed protein product [Vitrella brassicaformis CCMP3155]|uniref:Uncharacterized protein n=1 Tax=Vitrella brassicaformis (strain CCMP3155) TaxID=1169540 RepID=A0A0G4FHU2_VITBC|nr:unnamed protein product [Vitrella brassicaformis CCMP3155]|mmetsp:Transcript_7860/g.19322  ORF Transcript_7860/g.19322 Transcript_7860/m.19322 type:complete len:190 (-) Transcript_7860:1493-2062(-)|eukprot:CEM12647.1 unnamed protein product [Vitrella brassicaformis CCMP3155]
MSVDTLTMRPSLPESPIEVDSPAQSPLPAPHPALRDLKLTATDIEQLKSGHQQVFSTSLNVSRDGHSFVLRFEHRFMFEGMDDDASGRSIVLKGYAMPYGGGEKEGGGCGSGGLLLKSRSSSSVISTASTVVDADNRKADYLVTMNGSRAELVEVCDGHPVPKDKESFPHFPKVLSAEGLLRANSPSYQ